MLQYLKNKILGISYEETSFAKQGFSECNPATQLHLEKVIKVFLDGYHLAVNYAHTPALLVQKLDQHFENHLVGFAYEGTGMYLSLMDLMTPWKSAYLENFTKDAAQKHDYIVAVGAGFAIARVPFGNRRLIKYMNSLPAELAWCVPDGYGYHQGFFHHKEYIEQCKPPPESIPSRFHNHFDCGLGRSIWWVAGADPLRTKQYIDKFDEHRKPALWCGIGLACAYAGSINHNIVRELFELSGSFQADFLSGIPFAARMRQKGGNFSNWTGFVCRTMLNKTQEETGNLIVAKMEQISTELDHAEESLRLIAYDKLRQNLIKTLRPNPALITN